MLRGRRASAASAWLDAAADEFLAATDVADLLVRRGLPFREAHGVVAGLVRRALEPGQALSELTARRAGRARPSCSTTRSTRCSRRPRWLESKVSEGGTALARVREQLDRGARGRRSSVSALAARSSTRPVLEVAPRPDRLRRSPTAPTGGVIVETEAYHESEPACHAYVGLTPAHGDAVRAAGAAPTSTAPTASTRC